MINRLLLIVLGCLFSFAAGAQTINITPIGSKSPSAAFTVAGTLASYGSPPTLQYSLNGGSFVALPGGSSVSTTAFSFAVPAQTTIATSTLNVRDANSPSITASAQFAITNSTETPTGFYTTVVGTVITDSCNEAFAISPVAGSFNQQIYQNGIIDGVTQQVTQIAYVNHTFYQFGSGAWYSKVCAANPYVLFGTTSPVTTPETISINAIGTQNTTTPVSVTGSIAGAVEQPQTKYQVNAGAVTPFSYTTINGPFSFLAGPLPAAAVNTITILDSLTGVNAVSGQFCVASGAAPGQTILLIFGVSGTYPYVSPHANF